MTRERMKVSVVIPVRNGGKTLTRCLYSVLNQDFRDYDVTVVDNNSTDDTKAVIERFRQSDPRVRHAFEKRVSRGAARNRGIMECHGNVILMTDSDCQVPADWISAMTAPITDGEYIVQGGEDMAPGGFWPRMQQQANERLMESLSEGGYVRHIDTKNIAFRRDVLERVGMFDRHVRTFEDYEMKLRLISHGYRIRYLRDVRVVHRHRESAVKLFRRRLEMGKWITFVNSIHPGSVRKQKDEMVKSLTAFHFLAFFPWTLLVLLRRGVPEFVFELFTGTAWRIGIVSALISKTKTPYFLMPGIHSYDVPYVIEFEINSMCNMRCSYCPNDKHERKQKGFMRMELFRKCIDELSGTGYSGFITYHFYGEPLLDKRLEDFVKYASLKCPEAKSIVFTNGDFLNEKRFRSLADSGVYRFFVTHHRKGSDKRLKLMLSGLSREETAMLKTFIPSNLCLYNRAGAVSSVRNPGDHSRNPCPRPSFNMIVTLNGNVLPCCNDYFEKEVMGNASDETLESIWNSDRFRRFRSDLLRGKRNDHELCRDCDWEEDMCSTINAFYY